MILERIRAKVKEEYNHSDDLFIRGLWSVDCLFNPNLNERVFNYKFIVAQNIGQGCAYSPNTQYEVDELKRLMGKHYLDMEFGDIGLEVAILDAIFSTRHSKEDLDIELAGNSIEKSIPRARIIADEAFRLVPDVSSPKIVNVGVVGNIIKELLDRGAQVKGSDFDHEIIGQKMFDQAEIFHGSNTLDLIKENDVAIVTGMTLATQTLDEIVETAQKYNTKIVLFAETGANLIDFYLEAGIDTVVSEPFPFYIFQGKTTVKVYRKK